MGMTALAQVLKRDERKVGSLATCLKTCRTEIVTIVARTEDLSVAFAFGPFRRRKGRIGHIAFDREEDLVALASCSSDVAASCTEGSAVDALWLMSRDRSVTLAHQHIATLVAFGRRQREIALQTCLCAHKGYVGLVDVIRLVANCLPKLPYQRHVGRKDRHSVIADEVVISIQTVTEKRT